MDGFVRVRDVAIELGLGDRLGEKTEGPRVGIAGLDFQLSKVDGPPVEPAWGAGLKAGQLETTTGQAVAEGFGRLVACPTSACLRLSHVHDGLQKRPGCEYHSLGPIQGSALGLNSDDAPMGGPQLLYNDRLDNLLAQC